MGNVNLELNRALYPSGTIQNTTLSASVKLTLVPPMLDFYLDRLAPVRPV